MIASRGSLALDPPSGTGPTSNRTKGVAAALEHGKSKESSRFSGYIFVLAMIVLCAIPSYGTTLRSLGLRTSTQERAGKDAYVPLITLESSDHSQNSVDNLSFATASASAIEAEAKKLLSHVLVTIAYWHSPKESEVKFLGHTLGTIREWRLLPEVGNLTVVIVTNDAKGVKKSLGHVNNDWYTFHEVNSSQPFHMPFYHREVIADYLDRGKDGVNITFMSNKDLPPPTAYSFFEADTVLNGAGLLSWARDSALIHHEGASNRIRHFFRWEWNEDLNCPVFNGQKIQLWRKSSDRIIAIGGKRFISLTGCGVWTGMYVLPAQHMINYYYNSGSFWTLPHKYDKARELQLHAIIHGNNKSGKLGKREGDNTLVPMDERTGTVDVIAGVHHQSDKYIGSPWFGKLCIKDLFFE
ncbi:hypothetical protein ACHAXM_009306 [Skeletonema potamos]|jgi:hypothetical protein